MNNNKSIHFIALSIVVGICLLYVDTVNAQNKTKRFFKVSMSTTEILVYYFVQQLKSYNGLVAKILISHVTLVQNR